VDPSTAGIAGKKETAGGCESVVRSYTNDEVWKIIFTIGLCVDTQKKKKSRRQKYSEV
jgi:hypothetical protein